MRATETFHDARPQVMITPEALVDRFRDIDHERMRGLPIVNPELEVEAIGFRRFEDHLVGILITPWFMNLLLLPASAESCGLTQGAIVERQLPHGNIEFTACSDEVLGDYLSAIMFRAVTDFPDQAMARAVAKEILLKLFTEPEPTSAAADRKVISRRALLSGQGGA